MLAVLLGCGLRRSEVAALTLKHIQQRDNRWCIVDLVGKHAFVVADEVHMWKTRKQLENWDVLSKGGITRRQTLTIAITTAGVQNESPLA